MQEATKTSSLPRAPSIIVIQLFDIGVHVATDQVESIRILSNAIIGGWAVWSRREAARIRTAGFMSIAIDVVPNLAFLVMNGLTHPDKGDAPRARLFSLVGLTTALVLWHVSRRRGVAPCCTAGRSDR